jgi:hypothetical protein
MVTIELKDGTILRLNLKSRDREKSLRDAWYSMSDMPRMHHKELNITADTGSTYQLKVGEILNCEFKPVAFDRRLPEESKKAAPPPKRYENSVIPQPTPYEHECNGECEEGKCPFATDEDDDEVDFGGIIKRILEHAAEILESIPLQYRNNIALFMEGLHEAGENFLVTDARCLEIASAAMRADDPLEVKRYVHMYLQYLRSRK